MKVQAVLAVAAALLAVGRAHSWVECTKYKAEITGQDYSDAECEGYPRNWRGTDFGLDTGRDNPTDSNACKQPIGTPGSEYSDSYAAAYPMAEYTVGETVRIVWPAKNHANYECFQNIPDNSLQIWVSSNKELSTDPTGSAGSGGGWELMFDWHAQPGAQPGQDGTPFQNCPKFCENTDKAVCYGDLTIPTSGFFGQGDGIYTFLWYWEFNQGQAYTECFEAKVTTTSTVTGDTEFDDSTGSVTPTGTLTGYDFTIVFCVTSDVGSNFDELVQLLQLEIGNAIPNLEGTVTVAFSDALRSSFEFTATFRATGLTGVVAVYDDGTLGTAAQTVFTQGGVSGAQVRACDIGFVPVYSGAASTTVVFAAAASVGAALWA